MYVDERTADLRLSRDNRTYYFCSSSCLEAFASPERELSRLRRRLAVAWPFSVAIVLLTYAVHPTGWAYAAFALAAVVQLYSGGPFYRGTWDAIRSRVANMDVLIAVGTTVAFVYSAVALFLPGSLPSAYYFDASALIVTLILTGNYLEHLTRERATSAVRRLPELLPSNARVVRNGREVELPVSEIRAGDRIRIPPGGRIPTDGLVRVGRSDVDESLLTGESLPVEKAPGARVIAGSLNGNGALEVEATEVGEDTFLAQVGRLLADAEASHVPLQRLADRIAERFVPLVLGLALIASAGWGLLGVGLTTALLVFVSVAITACPCAFGIATPAAIVVGTGRAAEEGVLFRGSDALERAARVDLVLTDKTGTLTKGTPKLTELIPAPGTSATELLELAAGLEAGSEHPLARAVLRAAAERGVEPRPIEGVVAEPGIGVRASLEGREVAVRAGGALGPRSLPSPLDAEAERLDANGRTWSVVLRDGRPIGLLGFFDAIVPGVAAAVRRLEREGIGVVMVTGDNERAARAIAAEAGILEVHAGLSPAGKVALLREKQASGRTVAFVGDGVNDAPVLAAADLGIAIGTGTDVAREAGNVLLVRPEFAGVPVALVIGRRTVSKVRQNLYWALGYNAVLLPIAAGALVPLFGLRVFQVLPIAGALAMGLSSTTVVLNSLGVRRGLEERARGPRGASRPAPASTSPSA
jgi:Cu+-exporting ATPase